MQLVTELQTDRSAGAGRGSRRVSARPARTTYTSPGQDRPQPRRKTRPAGIDFRLPLLPTFLIVAVLCSALFTRHADAATCTLTVHLSADTQPATFRASGFLHGISASAPSRELVESLRPRLFRTTTRDVGLLDGPGIYERAAAMGAEIQVDLSSSYGCPATGPCPGDDGDWSTWDSVIDYLLSARKRKGYRIQWDIWNEPNLSQYWARDHERYLEMWRRTVKKIRADDPRSEIVGPSICGYDSEWLYGFLTWAKSAGVLPDVISWHEFGAPSDIAANAAALRAFLKRNGIRIKRFSLNEMVGPHHLTQPGPTACYLWAVEEARIESAAHSCWEDKEDGVVGCGSDSLDGILIPNEKKPRATWWVYRRYAEVSGSLVRVDTCASARGIAGRDDSNKQVAALIGRCGQEKVDVRVRFTGLDRVNFFGDRVSVTVERIPDSGWDHLPEPEVVQRCVRHLFGGEITVVVPGIGPSDACFVRLSPT